MPTDLHIVSSTEQKTQGNTAALWKWEIFAAAG